MATTPAFQIVQENLLRTFLKIFQDTVPQFIGENNTQVQSLWISFESFSQFIYKSLFKI